MKGKQWVQGEVVIEGCGLGLGVSYGTSKRGADG